MNSQRQIAIKKLREFKSHRGYKYLVSLVIVTLAAILQNLMWEYIEPAPFILFYPAVILACLHGDGNFAILLSCLAYQYYFVPPPDTLRMLWPDDYLRMSLFLISTIMIRKIIRGQTTEKLKAEAAVERLEESEKKLMLEREAREKFVSTLTHDLQTPLTAAKLHLELIKRKKDDPEAITKSLIKTFSNITRVEVMIQNLLDANRIKAGEKMHVIRAEVSMNSIIDKTIKDMTAIHGDRFKTKCPEDITGVWSAESIRRILENLCNNAVKYGDESPITICTDVIKDGVILSVNNKGSTVSEEESKRLFDPFQRANSVKGQKKGWGIGLTLVKGLTEAHNGTVSVQSDEKDGTTFSIYLPTFIQET